MSARAEPLYLAEVQGANAMPSRTHVGQHALVAATSMLTSWEPLRVVGDAESGEYDGPVALFRSKSAAENAALDACWNGQRYRARAARGRFRATGRVVDANSAARS